MEQSRYWQFGDFVENASSVNFVSNDFAANLANTHRLQSPWLIFARENANHASRAISGLVARARIVIIEIIQVEAETHEETEEAITVFVAQNIVDLVYTRNKARIIHGVSVHNTQET